MIGEIGGRIIDMIVLADGNFVDGRILGRALWEFPDDIDRFMVVQHKRGEAKLLIKPARPIPNECLRVIENRLRNITRDKLAIEQLL